jgi:hypothetical protein
MSLEGVCPRVTQPTYLAGDPRVGGRVVVIPSPLEEQARQQTAHTRALGRRALDGGEDGGGRGGWRVVMGEEDGGGRGKGTKGERRARDAHKNATRSREHMTSLFSHLPSRTPSSSLVLRLLLRRVPHTRSPRRAPLAASVIYGRARLRLPQRYTHNPPRLEVANHSSA